MALCASAAFAIAPHVDASVSIPVEFRQLVREAEMIVRGHVTDVRPIQVEGAGVESVATVAVDSVLKGPADAFVYVQLPGGAVGRYRYVMVGAPTLHVNESAVFFLRRGADNAWRPVGLAAGIYAVGLESGTGRAVVRPPALSDRTAGGALVRGDVRRKLTGVTDFESLIRLVLTARVAAPRAAP